MKNTITVESILEQIEDLGWNVEDEGDYLYRLSKLSPVGQDFSIQIFAEDAEGVAYSIYEAYSDFDVSSETYMWLDSSGHGTNGAPDDMRDIYDDMEACKEMILELYEVAKDIH